MKVASHLEKIDRFEDLRRRLDKVADFELWYWVVMNSATNALNAALHVAGITEENDCFPVQPGVYLEPGYPAGTFEPVIRPPGDVIHADRPRIEADMPVELQRIVKAMQTIESHRDPCIRHGREATAEIISTCETAYLECLSVAGQVIQARRGLMP
jgi:hypothetical protein